jgi:hypothetical protein
MKKLAKTQTKPDAPAVVAKLTVPPTMSLLSPAGRAMMVAADALLKEQMKTRRKPGR